MPANSMTVTDIEVSAVALRDEEFRDEVFTAASAKTFPAGTIFARDSVSLKLVVFAKGGSTNQNGIPKAVLTYPLTTTGAADYKVRALVKGTVDKSKLIIDVDGTGVNIDGAVLDQLRDYDIIPIDVNHIAGFDTHD